MSKIPSELKKILARDNYGKIGFRYLNLKWFNPEEKEPPSFIVEVKRYPVYKVPVQVVSGKVIFEFIHPQYCYRPGTPVVDNFGFFSGDEKENKPVATDRPTPTPGPIPGPTPTPTATAGHTATPKATAGHTATATLTKENKTVDGIYKDMKSYKYQFVYSDSLRYYNCIMKKVEKKLLASGKWGPGRYNLMIRNCHHFMQEAIKLYNSILQEKIKQYDRSIRGVKRTIDGAV